jgi:signal recognition particle-docking protein FtsY
VSLWPFGKKKTTPDQGPSPNEEVGGNDVKAPQEIEEKSLFGRLASGLSRSSDRLGQGVLEILTHRRLDDDALEELEEQLIMADLGTAASAQVVANFRAKKFPPDAPKELVLEGLAQSIADILIPCEQPLELTEASPTVILMVGVNGTGKTTTIGKLCTRLLQAGHRPILGAGDTFRAAAIEQLSVWGKRNNVPVVARAQGADAAAVAFDTMQMAVEHHHDVAIIDTAGRLQNRSELMDELAKIRRVIGRARQGAPDHVLLVLDATTGQNALAQAEAFGNIAGVTGLVVTKLDGSARGGVVVALAQKFGLPIHAIGVGEALEDLQNFSALPFARALVGLHRHGEDHE